MIGTFHEDNGVRDATASALGTGAGGMRKYLLKLYVSEMSSALEQAIRILAELFEERAGGLSYELQVIDIHQEPSRAEEARLLATPTLIKEAPLPMRRLIGDLSNREKLIQSLDLNFQADGLFADQDGETTP